MVKRSEILQLSKLHNVPSATIDKDRVLGHILNAFYSFNDFSENFVFKGGTCLRKCYYEDYRFSEDLDFTLLNRAFTINESLFLKYLNIAEKNSGIKFGKNIVINKQIHNDQPQGYEIIIPFWGLDHKPNQKILPENRWQSKIKIDISFSEKLILKPTVKPIFHPYSDYSVINSRAVCYSINEIISEKIRSLMQRNRPRDIYDLYFLSLKTNNSQYENIYRLLVKKLAVKNLRCCSCNEFINPSKAVKNKRAWRNSLSHHMAENKLIGFDNAYQKVGIFVNNILKHRDVHNNR